RTLVAGIALSLTVLIAATVVALVLARRESRERDRADQGAYRANTLAAGLALSTNTPRYARELLGTLEPAPGAWEFRRLKRLTEQWLPPGPTRPHALSRGGGGRRRASAV